MSRSLWRLIWSLSLCLESLVTEEPRDIGCLDTRGEGGGAIGVVTEPDLLEEELIMGSRDSHPDDNIVICNRDKMSVIKSVSLSRHLCQADPEFRVFYWELVIDIAEVWVTNSTAY